MIDAFAPAFDPLARPWTRLRFVVPILAVPLVTFIGLLLWQSDARAAFRALQLFIGWLTVAQMIVVLARVFERGWYEFLAYLLHFIVIGAAALTVTFRLEQYPQDLLYDQMALIGMGGQLMLGVMTLNAGPLRQQARLDPRVLTICAVIVCTCALIKFRYYIQFIGTAGGHSEIYTEGDALRDNSPAIVRILAAGAPLIGLLALTQPGLPRWCRALGALSIMLEFAIGIRSRPLFILLGVVALVQARLRLTRTLKLLIVAAAIVAVITIAAIGYYRENNSVSAAEYFWVILESLFGVFEAGVFGAQIPDTTPIVLGQIGPLLAPTPLGSVDTISKLLTSTFTPKAYLAGYGYSSAALTEVTMLLGPVGAGLIYPIAVFGIVSLIKAAVTSRRAWTFLYGASTLPIAYYIWRAELWQMVVPAIKAAPFILVLLGADAFARLGERRAPLRGDTDQEPFAS